MNTISIAADIPEPAKVWLRATLGDYHVISVHRAGSQRTGVWQLSRQGENFFFKLQYDRQLWYAEVYNYQHWSAAYEPYLPRLQAVFDDGEWQGLLLTAIAGKTLKEGRFDEATVAEVHRQAGRLCRRLRDLAAGPSFGLTAEHGKLINYRGEPIGEAGADPVTFIRQNFVDLLQEAQAVQGLEPDEQAHIDQALATLAVFEGELPTLVNTDFTPNNWLVDPAGHLVGIIDLEHVMRNVEVEAFTRLLTSASAAEKRAFFDGYGSDPLATKLMQARILCIKYALFYLGAGIKEQNSEWLQRGKGIFRRLDTLFAF